MRQLVKNIFLAAKERIFPVFCIDCGKEGTRWCEGCWKRKLNIRKIKADGHLEDLTAFFDYHEEGSAAKLIKEFKYYPAKDIGKIWKNILCSVDADLDKSAVLIPVPLFMKRLRERGFNQAEIIAFHLAEANGNLVGDRILKRIRHTEQQAKLDREGRKSNVNDAFFCEGDRAPKSVILVDDIVTTGFTMQECARVLIQAGSESVKGFALAHGSDSID